MDPDADPRASATDDHQRASAIEDDPRASATEHDPRASVTSDSADLADAEAIDPWAWVDEAREADEVELTGQHVTAIMVAHDGAEWLPAALAALDQVQRRPDRVILVDAGSTDDSAAVMAAAVTDRPGWTTVTTEAGHFGRAVAAALDTMPEGADGAEPSGEHWLWLLHDDAMVTPGSLGRLLAAALAAGAAVATPGLSQPATRQEPARVSELGESVARSGRREVHVDPGEIDQGQHHEVRPVLGGSTCGLLVRRDLYDRLGGLSPDLPGHRDGVEFGWRATLAGETVVAVPQAGVHHRQVGLGGLRAGSADAAAVDRAYGMALATAHASGAGRVFRPVSLVLGALLRTLGFLLGKSPERAGDEISGLRRYLAGGGRSGRLRAAATALAPTVEVRERADRLRPGRLAGLRLLRDTLGASWADRGDADSTDTDLDELTGDEFAGRGNARPTWRSAYLIVWAVSVVAAVVAARAVLGGGHLVGPALLPAADTVAGAYGQWLAPVAETGAWQAPPWLGLHALLATVLAGQPGWATALVVLGTVPLTMAAAWPLLRRTVSDRRIRVWAGLMMALVPVLLGASTQGRLGLTAVAVLAPLFVAAVLAMRDQWAGGLGWRHSWAAGLLVTALVAHQPVMAGLAVISLVALVVVQRGRGPLGALVARCGIVLAVPAVVLAPWWPTLFTHPGQWLLGPDAAVDGAGEAPAVWALLLGRPGGDGMPPWWVSLVCVLVIWLVALAATVLRPTSRGVRTAWVTAVVALLLAVLVTRVVVGAGAGLEPTRPSAGALLVVALGALVMAGAIGIEMVPALLSGRDFSWLQPVTALVAALLALTCLLGTGWWVVAGGSGPLQRDDDQVVPTFVVEGLHRQPGSRVLVVDATVEPVGFIVVDASGVRLGDADRGYAFGADRAAALSADGAARRLVAATGDETVTEDLRALGVRYIAVRGPAALITGINSSAGLRVVSVQPGSRVWEITGAADSPPPRGHAAIAAREVSVAVGQAAVLLAVAFCAAPRLRPGRSKDPAQRARQVAAREGT